MRKSCILVLFIVSLLVGIVYLERSFQPVKAALNFSDNFTSGVVANGWTIQKGSWVVSNGGYRVSVGIVENGISTVNGLGLADCVIQTQFRFTDAVGFRTGIVFRYTDYQHYYALEISNEYDKIELIKYSPADPEYGTVLPVTYGSNNMVINANVDYNLRVEAVGSVFNAYLDGKKVLSSTDDSYSSGLVGLRARRADVSFDYFLVNSDIQTPSLTTSCISSFSQSSFNVKINGALAFKGEGISGAHILLSYSVSGGDSWHELTLVHTGSDGSYSALWMLSVTGDYMLMAVYQGDNNHLGTSNVVNFSIVPDDGQSAFSVTSNSTLSALSFDSASKELSFGVSGESGTVGYVNVYIPKTLVNDVSGLKVYLDSDQVDYAVQSQGDGWLLYFTYQHSAHLVTISLGSSSVVSPTIMPTQTSSSSLDWVNIAILVMMGIVVATVVVTAFVFLSKKNIK